MIDPAIIDGKRVAMIAWAKNSDGSDDVRVFVGTGRWDGQQLVWVYAPQNCCLTLQSEWLERMKAVTGEVKDILLGADYCFSVSVGNIEEAETPELLVKIGLKWPREEEAG